MTEVTVVRRDDGTLVGLEARNHAGETPAGENLVCASITIVFEFLGQVTDQIPSQAVDFHQEPEMTQWSIRFYLARLNDKERFLTSKVLQGALNMLENIQNEYPDKCKILDS